MRYRIPHEPCMLLITEIFSAGQEGDLCGPMSSDCVWVSERPKLRALAHAAGLRNSGRGRESLAFTLSPHLPSCQSAETLHVDFTYSLLFLPSGNSGLASLFFFFSLLFLKKKKKRQGSSALFTCSEILKGRLCLPAPLSMASS